MTEHKTGTHEEWLAARLQLLEAEKELTRRSDELAQKRQELPWVRIDKEYQFETDEGATSLADLFRGRSQLLVYHFMFGPDYTAGCPSCSAIADGFNGSVVHLANHDVAFWAVSRAPLEKLQAYKRRMGWSFPWASSFEGDFNYDFHVTHSKEEWASGAVDYNFRSIDFRPAEGSPCSPSGHRALEQTSRRTGEKGPARAHSCSRMASCTTPIRRTNAGLTPSGACTSGSTARHSVATRPASGGAATTSTTASDRLSKLPLGDQRALPDR